MEKRRNSYGAGTEKYYQFEAESEGFKTPKEWADWHFRNNPICRYCKTPKDFAMGTGDCGCEGDDPTLPMFIPNPKRDK